MQSERASLAEAQGTSRPPSTLPGTPSQGSSRNSALHLASKGHEYPSRAMSASHSPISGPTWWGSVNRVTYGLKRPPPQAPRATPAPNLVMDNYGHIRSPTPTNFSSPAFDSHSPPRNQVETPAWLSIPASATTWLTEAVKVTEPQMKRYAATVIRSTGVQRRRQRLVPQAP